MAHYIADHYLVDGVPLVIVENEIGEVSVDSSVLGGFQVRELFSGCICCTLTADLAQNVQQICREYAPEYILVETTGMACPEKAASVIRQYVPQAGPVEILGLADAERWEELMDFMDVFIASQLGTARWILLNKMDTVDVQTVNRIRSQIGDINKTAEIFPVCAKHSLEKELDCILGGWI